MKQIIYFYIVGLLALSVAGFPALAQDQASLSDADLTAMEGFYDQCLATPELSGAYDCRCLAVKYLDARAQNPEITDTQAILDAMNKAECPRTAETDERINTRISRMNILRTRRIFMTSAKAITATAPITIVNA